MSEICSRPEWMDFTLLDHLLRRAGVAVNQIVAVAVKELVENSLDEGAKCWFDELEDEDGFYVEDDNQAGISGDDEAVARLFAINRDRMSSKYAKLPKRGALGNGLRVVSGLVLATGGSLIVRTNGRSLAITVSDTDGSAKAERIGDWPNKGTRIEVRVGRGLPQQDDWFRWARRAQMLANAARCQTYAGRSSPRWYTSEMFYDLTRSWGDMPIRDAVANYLEGCSKKGAEVTGRYSDRTAVSLSKSAADDVLIAARAVSQEVEAHRLGKVGPLEEYPAYSQKKMGVLHLPSIGGRHAAEIPFVVEAWAIRADEPEVNICINRGPITGKVSTYQSTKFKTYYVFNGCNIECVCFKVGRGKSYKFLVNIICPVVGLRTDGKEPDLAPFQAEILAALERVAGSLNRANAKRKVHGSKVSFIRNHLADVLAEVGKGGRRFSLRHFFYQFRKRLIDAYGEEPRYGTFSKIIADIEAEDGKIPGLYRDVRGTIYHPHLRQSIPLGTLAVEAYRRPEWTFTKIIYIEKEGFFPLLIEAGFPEKYDCAILSAKGFATKAATDILDLLGTSTEPTIVFAAHDADGPGTVIGEVLNKSTRDNVQVIDVGLHVPEARAMGLLPEVVKRTSTRRVPVASTVSKEDAEWLQKNRYELNSMQPDLFISWLESKMAPYHTKLVPGIKVLKQRLEADARQKLADAIRARILKEAGFDNQVALAYKQLTPTLKQRTKRLAADVSTTLTGAPARSWMAAVGDVATELADGAA